jgi:CRP/FNR family transcriptional regulator, anaerobic regulatory protein
LYVKIFRCFARCGQGIVKLIFIMEEVIKQLNEIYPLSDELKEYLGSVIKERPILKKEYLLKAGHTCRNICFISKGLLRCFYLQNSQEVSSWFMMEGDVIISVESFFTQTKSKESIQALEDCLLYSLDYADLQYMYRNFPESNFVGRVLTEKYYILSEQRLYSLKIQKAPGRYQYILENFPVLLQRVPAKYIASYLGVSEETVSRIRSKKIIY